MKACALIVLALSNGVITAFYLRGPIGSPETIHKPQLDFTVVEKEEMEKLQSTKSRVVDSALEPLMFMRIAFPNEDFREIEQQLYVLAARGATRSIRYKAYLAIEVFADPSAFRSAIESRQLTGTEFLAEVAHRVQR